MTTPPTLRALALDAVAQALNTGRYWLPADGQAAVADAVLDAVDAEPAERCGATFPAFEGAPPTECILRPGHQGSHANEDDTRWIETPNAATTLHAPACVHCDNTRLDPNDLGDWDPTVGRIVPGSQAPCPECVGRDACLDNPLLTAAIGLPIRCPHCETTVPPTHWTKHLQRHHPEADAGYCPHCGRGDAGPTADEYEQARRNAVRIQTLLDETRDRARKDAAASRESERQLQQQIDAQAREIDRLRDELAAEPREPS